MQAKSSCNRMAVRNTFILILSGFLICQQVAKCNPGCIIQGHDAYCSAKSLTQVPVLPLYITYADLSQNFISEVHQKSFIGLEGLQMLNLGFQKVRGLVIKNNAFSKLYNLTYLHLGSNIRLHIESGAFNGLSNLQSLVLLRSGLNDSILSGNYLRPLVSLESLQLFGNDIHKIQPAQFFLNFSKFHILDLSLNWVPSVCETDLSGFQGKHFSLLKLSSIHLTDMRHPAFNWVQCGNPFRNISMEVLDLSLNGFSADMARPFFKAISGTKIQHLILRSSAMGKSFGYSNLPDPDKYTFQGLRESSIKSLDLSKTFILSLQSSLFSALGELEILSLAEGKINKMERNAFLGMTNLLSLNLSYNLLGEIYSETFENLPNLLVLDLSYNHIGVMAPDSFSQLSNLVRLDLRGNALRYADTFTLPNLKVVRLDDNKITTLNLHSHITNNITVIQLDSNRLSNLQDLYEILATSPDVEEIYVADNHFLWCTHDENNLVLTSNKLKVLDMRKTGLSNVWIQEKCLNMFGNLSHVLYLFLNQNALKSLPKAIFKGLISLHYLDLSLNYLTYLPPDIFPKSLKAVNLAHNSLGSPDPNIFTTLSLIDLSNNLFICDCHLKEFLMWMNDTNVTFFRPVNELTCEFPEALHGVPLTEYNIESCQEDDDALFEKLRVLLCVMCTTLITLITCSTIAFVRFRGYFFKFYKEVTLKIVADSPKTPTADDCPYDVYICFNSSDFKWVERALLKKLDSQFSEQNHLRCCIEARDFIPGEDHLSNMRNAIWGSKKTVCVVSKKFLRDGWCLEAFTLAQCRMLSELRDILVVILVGNLPLFKLMKHDQIRSYIKKREYLQWPEDSQDVEWFYSKLMHKIIKNTKLKKTKPETTKVIELTYINQQSKQELEHNPVASV
ncbi:toll-like receptor 5 [Chanos chanos]|uniref:Toll-like receptor 5 n=1 Tax=Chanos chanos TaxID=29144 RepID=A0A6J2V6B7_CHACN|nr:toll-like receptor 5 [Chanos chanos]